MTTQPPKVAIFEDTPPRRHAGGPPGYLWHLREGLKKIGDDTVAFVTGTEGFGVPPSRIGNLVNSTRRLSDPLWRALKTYGPSELNREVKWLTQRRFRQDGLPGWAEAQLVARPPDILHCHKLINLLQAHNSLVRLGLRDKVSLVVTTHSPEVPSRERVDMMRRVGLLGAAEPLMESRLAEMDRLALSVTDHFIFPCAEATEPYFATWPDFTAHANAGNTSYVLTGIEDPSATVVKDHFPLPRDKKVFAFVGRHNAVKGYDLLASVARRDRLPESVFIAVAGVEGPEATPSHPRWKEFGWTDKALSLIAASDALILPNRSTYFDLVSVETLSVGVPIIASATGGNKRLGALSEGVILFEPTESGMEEAIARAAAIPKERLLEMGRQNRALFERLLTNAAFAQQYLGVYREIQERFASGQLRRRTSAAA
ncbi:glycosyltransferase family 4 protein [Ancylobacter lacus]|uniref:glycosyltransferase family 4 protein n=1 Tax=Ancylobacter lacus TaxID=2579970 RepID=UPI001BCBA344|nr:glycosyltransferase family 4 protein [Ancylobacter lacus]MBS7538491.1 glycosyltransferase family 4 protein [Ancylobacter lacus]